MDDVIEMARYLGLSEQQDGESDRDFRIRVADVLRGKGRLIESQEILVGRRFDDPANPPVGVLGNPLTGVAGALAQAMQGIDYRNAEDDAVAGAYALAPPDPAKEAMRRAFDMLGPAAIDLFTTDVEAAAEQDDAESKE